MRKTEVRLISSTRSQASSGKSTAGARTVVPALLTRMSTEPQAAKTSATTCSRKARWDMSPRKARTGAPKAAISAQVSSGIALLLRTATRAPASARATAAARPMPREAPVTMAAFPSRRKRFIWRAPGRSTRGCGRCPVRLRGLPSGAGHRSSGDTRLGPAGREWNCRSGGRLA